jgi:hypothetical protein
MQDVGLVEIDPITKIQEKYLYDDHRFCIVAAGRRSRKTLIAKQKILMRAVRHPGTLWFHAAPTYNQAKAIFWDGLKTYTKIFREKKEPSESNLYVELDNKSQIHVIGLDKAQRIEGRTKSWDGCHVAEFGDVKPGVWETNIRPVLADTNGSAILDGVPDPKKTGFAEHKRFAKYACGGTLPTTEELIGAYGENPEDPEWCFFAWYSSDVLPPKEMLSIKNTTDTLVYRIEYEANFDEIAGKVYYDYIADYYPKGNLDKDIVYDPSLPIVMGFDFNVNPMTAVLGHVRRNKNDYQEWLLFKGYFLKASNTEQLIRRIFDDYSETYTFILTPCQSSIARQTSQEITSDGYKTDLAIVKNVAKEYGKNLQIAKRTKNPPTHKGISATNTMLNNLRLRINPNDIGLKELIKDFDSLSYKEGTSAIDETDKMRNHISAAVRYVCDRHWRVRTAVDDDYYDDIIS